MTRIAITVDGVTKTFTAAEDAHGGAAQTARSFVLALAVNHDEWVAEDRPNQENPR